MAIAMPDLREPAAGPGLIGGAQRFTCEDNISSLLNQVERDSGVKATDTQLLAEDGLQLKAEKLSYQAAGHSDNLLESKGTGPLAGTTILKRKEEKEYANYKEVFDSKDALVEVLPKFYGCIQGAVLGDEDGSKGDAFIVLQNILMEFREPFVMDCKVGTRSFEEAEAANAKPRKDLYQRLLKIGPEHLSEEEMKSESITKHKWMSTRDEMSSLQSLGFRIDGIVGPGGLKVPADYFATISDRLGVLSELKGFFRRLREAAGERGNIALEARLLVELASRLRALRATCERSHFFATHEFVGASVLIVAEATPPRVSAHIIDLAKTSSLPDGLSIDHRKPWMMGNHEDGFLFGLDNCIACLEEMLAEIPPEHRPDESLANTPTKPWCCQS
mmetsp:Transcript_45556/g.105632  ORF Transcript_45556/g.105632 Transcript_45556/m.105632 type:complete len:389 (+) Transcript_45556:16-1182(+)